MPSSIDIRDLEHFWPSSLAAAVLFGLGIRWLLRRRRSRALAEAPDNYMGLPEIHLFSQGEDPDFRNVLRGDTGGLEAALFDYSYSTGSGKNRHTITQTVAAFHRPGTNMPDFQIRPRTFFRTLAAKFGRKEVSFADHPQFSQRYIVSAADSVGVAATFTPGILSFLEGRAESRYTIEGYCDWMIVYRPGKTVRAVGLAAFLEDTSTLGNGILTQVPKSLRVDS